MGPWGESFEGFIRLEVAKRLGKIWEGSGVTDDGDALTLLLFIFSPDCCI